MLTTRACNFNVHLLRAINVYCNNYVNPINMSRYRVQIVREIEVPVAFYEYLMHRHTI
jgi:hypothetical protein